MSKDDIPGLVSVLFSSLHIRVYLQTLIFRMKFLLLVSVQLHKRMRG